MSDEDLVEARKRMARLGWDSSGISDEDLRQAIIARADAFIDEAPMTAAEAATIILDGVRGERWRILVGKDAETLDRLVRETPEDAYERSFMDRVAAQSTWSLGT